MDEEPLIIVPKMAEEEKLRFEKEAVQGETESPFRLPSAIPIRCDEWRF
ncbi:MAG: hypothetical protein ACYDHG_05605 [Desulfomonilaceae bacterium]